jgi:osmotically-inducible protein OsmY
VVTDQQLAELIRTAFIHDDRLSAQPVEVLVDNGVVTLRGTVQSFRRKLAAQEIAGQFEYVRDVQNHLLVEPAAGTADIEVAEHVRSALGAHADVTQEAITVAVEGGNVTLTGHVGSTWERAQAEDVARSARGVREVNNLLMVDALEAVAEEQLGEQIRAAFAHTRGLRDAEIHVAVSDAAVVLSGEVENLWQKQMAQSVAERFRLVRLRNEILVRGA